MDEELRWLEQNMRLVMTLQKKGLQAVIEQVEKDFSRRKASTLNEVIETMMIDQIIEVAAQYKIRN